MRPLLLKRSQARSWMQQWPPKSLRNDPLAQAGTWTDPAKRQTCPGDRQDIAPGRSNRCICRRCKFCTASDLGRGFLNKSLGGTWQELGLQKVAQWAARWGYSGVTLVARKAAPKAGGREEHLDDSKAGSLGVLLGAHLAVVMGGS